MRRSGYNSLNNSQDGEAGDTVDGIAEDLEEAKAPFTEIRFNEGKSYKKTLCLVFTLFFGGLVSDADNEIVRASAKTWIFRSP